MGVIPLHSPPMPATPTAPVVARGPEWPWDRMTSLEQQRQAYADDAAVQAGIVADQYEALVAANERIYKLQADLEAAQAIIADHGKTITRLRADLARAGAELDRLTTTSARIGPPAASDGELTPEPLTESRKAALAADVQRLLDEHQCDLQAVMEMHRRDHR